MFIQQFILFLRFKINIVFCVFDFLNQRKIQLSKIVKQPSLFFVMIHLTHFID